VTDAATLSKTTDSRSTLLSNRRLRERFPINCTILLTPLDQKGKLLTAETVTTIGKDLSQSGVCFTHDFELKHRRFLLSFNAAGLGEFFVEAEVARNRMTAIGLHETGCRMVRKIVAPSGFAQ
jgi:hypothetical protein